MATPHKHSSDHIQHKSGGVIASTVARTTPEASSQHGAPNTERASTVGGVP